MFACVLCLLVFLLLFALVALLFLRSVYVVVCVSLFVRVFSFRPFARFSSTHPSRRAMYFGRWFVLCSLPLFRLERDAWSMVKLLRQAANGLAAATPQVAPTLASILGSGCGAVSCLVRSPIVCAYYCTRFMTGCAECLYTCALAVVCAYKLY